MEEKIELLQLLKVISKRKTVIIVGTITCLLAGIFITAYMAPQYEASVRVLVTQGQSSSTNQPVVESYQAVLLSERLTKTLSQMITSRTLTQKVINDLNLRLQPEELEEKITAKPVKDTQLIQLSVTDNNPVLAKKLADSVAANFVRMTAEALPATALISVKVIEPAVVPPEPVRPKPLINISLAFLLGIVASTSFAFLLEILDLTVGEADEVEQLTGLSSLGRVPKVDNPNLLVNAGAASAEAYRSLRANLQYLNFDRSIKTLIVTSPNEGEGKTTTASNLAIVLAQAGNKVLLIDCDMRNPRVYSFFNKVSDKGLSSVLIDAADEESAVLDTSEKGLRIMTSGPVPPNPSDLLNSVRMDKLLASLKTRFDLIVLDTPPILAVSDATILAAKADAILLVAGYGKTKKNDIVMAKDALDKVGARTIGFILNGVEVSARYGSYYHKPYGSRQVAVDNR
ncbi:MAG: polysaccharide biosynthesis tyrosine autokinase [Firmicutes bacterium]|nr:polysaccharide biosynthesis tyrosine autokinase [Bacillota bacterium]